MEPVIEKTQALPVQRDEEDEVKTSLLDKIKGGLWRVIAGVVVFLLICGGAFSFAINTTTSAISANVPASAQIEPTPASNPVQLGYASETEAASQCEEGETVEPLWRNYQIVGYSCSKDLTRKSYGSKEAAALACNGNFREVRKGNFNLVFDGYICQ